MENEQDIRILLTSELLNLNPRIIDKRTVLCEVLIEVALYRLGYPATNNKISDEVNNLVKQVDFQKPIDVEKIISGCINKTIIRRNDKFELSNKRKKEFDEVFFRMDLTLTEVKDGLIKSIETEIGDPIDNKLFEEIYSLLTRLLTQEIYEYSIQLARGNLTIEEMIIQLDSSEPNNTLSKELDNLVPNKRQLLKSQIIGGISNYFIELPDALRKMLHFIHSNIIINQILNLDPSLVKIQKEWFSKRRIYLDTNVVLSFFFESHPTHQVVCEIIKASKDLNVQLFISPATLKELNGQVEKAKNNYRLLQQKRITTFIASKGDDVILATFVNLWKRQPSIQWKSYISPFDNFEEILLHKDILTEKEGVIECQDDGKKQSIKKSIEESKSPFVSQNVIEHDTLNFLLICYLRQKYLPDTRGQVIWLLTLDRSLKKAQRILMGSGIINNPYCMQISDWGEIVLPVQSVSGYKFPDFIGYLAQARLGALADPEMIQLDFIETIRDAEIDIDRLWELPPNQVVTVLTSLQTDREARLLLTQNEKRLEKEEKKKQLEFNSILDKAINETDPIHKLRDDYDREISILQKKLNQSNEKLQAMRKQRENSLSYKLINFFSRIINQIKNVFSISKKK